MSAGTFGPAITTDRIALAKTSIATVKNSGAAKVVTMRTANGVGDNQRLQMIADAVGRGEVTDSQVNA
jgi:hypothetical protein